MSIIDWRLFLVFQTRRLLYNLCPTGGKTIEEAASRKIITAVVAASLLADVKCPASLIYCVHESEHLISNPMTTFPVPRIEASIPRPLVHLRSKEDLLLHNLVALTFDFSTQTL